MEGILNCFNGGIKISRREWDLLILAGAIRDGFKIVNGMRDEKKKTLWKGRPAENRDGEIGISISSPSTIVA